MIRVAPPRIAGPLAAFLMGLGVMLAASPVQAQPADQDALGWSEAEVAVLTGWPESLPQLLQDMGTRAPRLLPEIDSLALEYAYAPNADAVDWSLQFAWRPGRQVLYEGRVLPRREAPSGLRMTSVEVLADVIVDGQRRAEMVVAVDSMRLAPQPDAYRFDVRVDYDRVFLNTPADAAQRFLERGVTLANLRIERMGFLAEGPGVTGDVRAPDREPDARERRPAPRQEPSVYEPRTRIGLLVGWRIGPDPYYVGSGGRDRSPRTEQPRGEGSGRTPATGDDTRARGTDRSDADRSRENDTGDEASARTESGAGDPDGESRTSGRTSRGDGNGDSDDKDDSDDDDLIGPALIAAGAVGAAAFIGGTAGVFGTGDTPIGLAAGYTHPAGGIQLQAAVNSAVLDNKGTQRLTVKAMGFYDVLGAPIQPALGIGAQAVAIGERTTLDPSVSVGAVGRLGRVVLYGAFDVAQQTPEFGLAINFRSRGDDSDEAIAASE